MAIRAVAGPYQGPTGGVVWHEGGVLFSVIDEGLTPPLRSADPGHRRVPPLCQSREWPGPSPRRRALRRPGGGRRLVEFTPDGRLVAVDALLDGKYHNQPCDLVVDSRAPHLVRRSAPCDDPVRPRDLSLSRPRLGAAAGAQRPPRMGGDARHLRYRFSPARCCCRRTRRRSMSPTANRGRTSGGSCAPIPIGADGSIGHPCGAAHVRRGPSRRRIAGSKACASMRRATSSPAADGIAADRGR